MKILHIEAGMHLYGGALQVVFLLKGLKERGIECVLACPINSAIATAAEPHARIITMPMKGDADLGLISRIRYLIRQERPDLVHLHSRRGIDIWGAVAARLENTPVVLSRRVDNPEPRWLVSIKYRLYDRVITISEGIKSVLLTEGVPANKISCVRSAVDTELYQPEPKDMAWFRQTFGLTEDQLTIGMVAQFIARKGHQTLLDALPSVVSKHPNTQVLLFGQGPIWNDIQTKVQNCPLLSKHVKLVGFRNDLSRVMPCLDIVAHPAAMEGLGVSLLQAAACGVPIVGARAGGIPEIVQPNLNGELIEPGDASSLAQYLSQLLTSSTQRAQYGQFGREWVMKHFSIPAMVDGNLHVYRHMLDQAS